LAPPCAEAIVSYYRSEYQGLGRKLERDFGPSHGTAPDRYAQWSSRADWYVDDDGLPVQD